MSFRRTKIIATLGPASSEPCVLKRLIAAGMDVARVNLSHGTHAEHSARIRLVRRLAREAGRSVGILFDLQGPKMRIGELKGHKPVLLRRGSRVWICTKNIQGDAQQFSTAYTHLPLDVRRGDPILLDDGRVRLEVVKVERRRVYCHVEQGGWISDHKGINLPGVALSAPAITEKDYKDIGFAIDEGVDYIALSFVRSGRDVAQLRNFLKRRRADIPIIAKIERAEAIAHLDDIFAEADGVMVARGDLGVELSLERVPVLQKTIIKRANQAGLLVITATQMLESMIDEPQPTRAEASDIANAIFDHTDAVMLSGETASGKFPVEAVKTMARIVSAAEASQYHIPFLDTSAEGSSATKCGGGIQSAHTTVHAIVRAACVAAREEHVRAIMCFTMTGATARILSKMRPARPVLALTAEPRIVKRMALYWGVEPFLSRTAYTTDAMIERAERTLLKAGRLKKGDRVVVVTGTTRLRGATNMMKFLTI